MTPLLVKNSSAGGGVSVLKRGKDRERGGNKVRKRRKKKRQRDREEREKERAIRLHEEDHMRYHLRVSNPLCRDSARHASTATERCSQSPAPAQHINRRAADC